ncbi:MAG: hypothetical protein COB04_05385 [Gammaproteobacteria bacterium]|nr:MAG: hypothetical protein COB04_05385 [Gammaproteobacteria bacterium]
MIVDKSFSSRIKYYAPVWVFPFVAIYAAVNEQQNGAEASGITGGIASICFFACNLPMSYAWTRGLIPVKEMILFWWLSPFLLWAMLVYLKVQFYG